MLHPDYQDILVALSDQQADFIVIGAYAMAAHGLVRATADIDLWVRPSIQNASKVWAALEDFGAPLHQLALKDLSTPGIIFQIGVKPVLIDILTQVNGLDDFDEAWSQAKIIELGGIRVPVLSRLHLIKNKKIVGRPSDLNDVLWLESDQSNKDQ